MKLQNNLLEIVIISYHISIINYYAILIRFCLLNFLHIHTIRVKYDIMQIIVERYLQPV